MVQMGAASALSVLNKQVGQALDGSPSSHRSKRCSSVMGKRFRNMSP